MIAVADPLWMFVPPEHLSAAELAVPVVTWINGVAHIGDLAHDHDHNDTGNDVEDELVEFLAAPLDFEAGALRLSSLLTRSSTSNSGELIAGPEDFATRPSGVAPGQTLVGLNAIETLASDSTRDQDTNQQFDSIDLAFGDAEEWFALGV